MAAHCAGLILYEAIHFRDAQARVRAAAGARPAGLTREPYPGASGVPAWASLGISAAPR